MEKRRISLMVLAILVAASMVFVGCQKKEEKAAEAGSADEPKIAAMATDVGGLGDKSFNDGAYEGLKMGESIGYEARVIESKQQTDYVPNLSGLAEDGAEVVFAVGFLMDEAVKEAAANNPDTNFAGIDIGAGEDAPANFQGILYKEEEAGYLAGIVAGLMTKKHADKSEKFNDENVVGCVLGMLVPAVEKYEVGFIQGAKLVNPDVKVLSVTTGSFTDQAKGKEAALAMIDQGADVIFHAAGLTGMGAIQAAKERGVTAIGVDVDQSNLAPDTVLTSAVKKIPESVYLTLKAVKEGNFQSGTKVFGIKDDATGISPFNAFEDIVPQEVKDKVAEQIAAMKAGEVTIETSRAAIGR